MACPAAAKYALVMPLVAGWATTAKIVGPERANPSGHPASGVSGSGRPAISSHHWRYQPLTL